MREGKRHSAFYQYLEPFLEGGNEALIKKAKAEWRRKYKAEWRKLSRKENKEITVSWTKDELSILKTKSKSHKQSITRFIKNAVMAYIDKRYIVPNQKEVNIILQLLGLAYNSIEEMQSEDKLSSETGRKLQIEIDQLERNIRVAIFSPKTIEQVLTEIIREKPTFKPRLIQFIETMT